MGSIRQEAVGWVNSLQERGHGWVFSAARAWGAKQGMARKKAAQLFTLLLEVVPRSLVLSFFSFPNHSGAAKNLCV